MYKENKMETKGMEEGGLLFTQQRRHIYVQKKRGQCRSLTTCGQKQKSRRRLQPLLFRLVSEASSDDERFQPAGQKWVQDRSLGTQWYTRYHFHSVAHLCARWISHRKQGWLARRWSLQQREARHTEVQNTKNGELNCLQHKFPFNTG